MTINDLFRKYCAAPFLPVLCIIDPVSGGRDADERNQQLPVQSYVAIDEIREESPSSGAGSRTFVHVNCGIEAEEAEEVGVEHLVRDLKDGAVSNLSMAVTTKTASLRALSKQLGELEGYLEAVSTGRLPPNQQIIAAAQDMFNLLPEVHSAGANLALTLKTNDQLAMIYLGSLCRAVIALDELIKNKLKDAATEASNHFNGINSNGSGKKTVAGAGADVQ